MTAPLCAWCAAPAPATYRPTVSRALDTRLDRAGHGMDDMRCRSDDTVVRIQAHTLPVNFPELRRGYLEDTAGPFMRRGPRQLEASVTMGRAGTVPPLRAAAVHDDEPARGRDDPRPHRAGRARPPGDGWPDTSAAFGVVWHTVVTEFPDCRSTEPVTRTASSGRDLPAGHIRTPDMQPFAAGHDDVVSDATFGAWRNAIVAQGLELVDVVADGARLRRSVKV